MKLLMSAEMKETLWMSAELVEKLLTARASMVEEKLLTTRTSMVRRFRILKVSPWEKNVLSLTARP